MNATYRAGRLQASGFKKTRWAQALSLAALTGAAVPGVGLAMSFDTGNPDWSLRLDNTVRYNLGIRAENVNPVIGGNPNFDESDYKFKDAGDIVTNRVDLLTEFETVYQRQYGVRLSGAAWHDFAYDSNVKFNPDVTQGQSAPADGKHYQTSYSGDRYSSHTKRFYETGAELLDAFVFANFRPFDVPMNIKAGRQNQYWGESVFFGPQSIAYSQGPIDEIKGAASPGAEVKELFLPQAQIALTAQLLPQLSFAAEYFLEWKGNRYPEGGTYLAGGADFMFDGPDRAPFAPTGTAAALNGLPAYPFGPACPPSSVTDPARGPTCFGVVSGPFVDSAIREGADKPNGSGNYGANLRWTPGFIDGTAGFYYRRLDERNYWSGIQFPTVAVAVVPGTTPYSVVGIPSSYRFVYPRGVNLYGLSYTRNVGETSVAAEVSYRQHTGLTNSLVGPSGSSFAGDEGPRGNTIQALVNVISLLPQTFLFDTGTVIAEVAYSNVNKVTSHPELFTAVGYAGCPSGKREDGCATASFWGAQVLVTPQWLQALPGVDLSAPLTYYRGLSGNAATLGGGFENNVRWSAGVAADIYQKYNVALAYNDSHAQVGAAQPYSTNDRGWVSLTFKASF